MQPTDSNSKDSTKNTSPPLSKKTGLPKKKPGPPKARTEPVPGTEYNATVNQERIEEAATIFRKFEFVPGKTGRELAKKWGVTDNYARQLVGKAWKLIREEATDIESAGATIADALHAIIRDGMASQDPMKRKLVIMACKELRAIVPGLTATTNVAINHSQGPTLPDSPEELRRLAQILLDRDKQLPDARLEYRVLPEETDE